MKLVEGRVPELGTSSRAGFAICALSLLASLAACSGDARPAQGAAAHDASDGHVHENDHAHGEGEEHAGEIVLSAAAVAHHGIEVEAAQLWTLRPTIAVPARIGFDTEAMAHVGSPLRGRATEVRVRVGDLVQVGQELALIESPELGEAQAEYLQRGVAVRTAGPAVELSKVAWDRARGLYETSQGISLTEVQRREAEHKVAVAALQAAESARTAAANRLRLLGMEREAIEALAATGEVVPRLAIRAAITGTVVQREVTPGELVGPDRPYLMVLADATKLWVLADVPEAKLARVRIGARAWVELGLQSASGAARVEGRVAFLAPVVDPTTRSAQVRIEIPTENLGLRPGMFVHAEIVEAELEGESRAPVVAVPEEALQTVAGSPVLFVPVSGEQDTFVERAVSIGRAVGGLVPIHAGLVEGEAYVRRGSFVLKAELGKSGAAHAH